MPQTPAAWYPLTTSVTVEELLITDFEGDRRLCSAIIPEWLVFSFFANEYVFRSKSGDFSQ